MTFVAYICVPRSSIICTLANDATRAANKLYDLQMSCDCPTKKLNVLI